MAKRTLHPWLVRLIAGIGILPLGVLLLVSGTASLLENGSEIPGGNRRPSLIRRLWGKERMVLPPQRVEPYVAHIYAISVMAFGMALTGLSGYAITNPQSLATCGKEHSPTRTNPLLGTGLVISASILGTLSWDMEPLRWIWLLMGAAGVFRLWRG